MQKKSELDGTGIQSEQLIEASRAWDGSMLPPYPSVAPVMSVVKYIFPPHSITNEHYHKVLNCGMVLKGVLTIVNRDGSHHDFMAGEAFIETAGEVHHGENKGDESVEIVMFYAGDGSTPLSFPAD